MLTKAIGSIELAASVVAVPPLARDNDFRFEPVENARLLRHIEGGGVRSILYGGNANMHHIGIDEYAEVVDSLAASAASDTWILPSIGPDYGKAMHQAAILRNRDFPTAMLLPMAFPYTAEGLISGIRRISDAYGRPIIIYIKSDDYVRPDALAELVEQGRVCALKYAVPRSDLDDDPYLAALIAAVGRDLIVSGNGERPILSHMLGFGLPGYTSGSVCIAPALSTALLDALRQGDERRATDLRARFLPLEDVRDDLGPIAALHAAVTNSGIATMGPMLPMMSVPNDTHRARIAAVVDRLMQEEAAYRALPVT